MNITSWLQVAVIALVAALIVELAVIEWIRRRVRRRVDAELLDLAKFEGPQYEAALRDRVLTALRRNPLGDQAEPRS